jgi:RNA:NAD 2'-phosphotransferase (TPT1/KptA family)
VNRFEVKWEEMKRELGKVEPKLAYHGTADANIPSILQKGLLVPEKDNNGVTHATGMVRKANSN